MFLRSARVLAKGDTPERANSNSIRINQFAYSRAHCCTDGSLNQKPWRNGDARNQTSSRTLSGRLPTFSEAHS